MLVGAEPQVGSAIIASGGIQIRVANCFGRTDPLLRATSVGILAELSHWGYQEAEEALISSGSLGAVVADLQKAARDCTAALFSPHLWEPLIAPAGWLLPSPKQAVPEQRRFACATVTAWKHSS
jgi:hypothetical protein